MQNGLPYSQASENNKTFILDVLRKHLGDQERVLEIGGGTGQHAVYFAQCLPYVHWQSTDIPANVGVLNQRILTNNLPNLPAAIALDVNQRQWHCDSPSADFTANSLHIMSEGSVRSFFTGIGTVLTAGGLLFIYGPFKYNGCFTTESNARFNLWLKGWDPVSGIRDFETIAAWAKVAGLSLLEDYKLPANNQMLVWRMSAPKSVKSA